MASVSFDSVGNGLAVVEPMARSVSPRSVIHDRLDCKKPIVREAGEGNSIWNVRSRRFFGMMMNF